MCNKSCTILSFSCSSQLSPFFFYFFTMSLQFDIFFSQKIQSLLKLVDFLWNKIIWIWVLSNLFCVSNDRLPFTWNLPWELFMAHLNYNVKYLTKLLFWIIYREKIPQKPCPNVGGFWKNLNHNKRDRNISQSYFSNWGSELIFVMRYFTKTLEVMSE